MHPACCTLNLASCIVFLRFPLILQLIIFYLREERLVTHLEDLGGAGLVVACLLEDLPDAPRFRNTRGGFRDRMKRTVHGNVLSEGVKDARFADTEVHGADHSSLGVDHRALNDI